MKSVTRLRAGLDPAGITRAVELRAEAPQLLRVTEQGAAGEPLVAHLVGGAAGPLGGDLSEFHLTLETGTRVTIRSVAATLVHPGARGGTSTASVVAAVGARAHLDWWPEPLITIAGCDHRLTCRIEAAEGAHVRWVDEIVAGRTGEVGGRLAVRQRVVVGGRVLADQEIATGPDLLGPGGHAGARVVISAVEVGGPARPASAPIVTPTLRVARLEPAPGLTFWVGLGDDLEAVRHALARAGLSR